MTTKNLCYELNEGPWRVVYLYVKQRPNSMLATLLSKAVQYTTHTADSGELHPWTTWPTLRRGVSNDVHNLRYLNQDMSDSRRFPQIWDILNCAVISTGLFGSLHSYPPSSHDKKRFHVPDTFASGADTKPARYAAFQSVNLKQTGQNSAAASKIGRNDVQTALGISRVGIRTGTFATVARYLVSERINPLQTRRRALLQPVIAFDVFLHCLRSEQP